MPQFPDTDVGLPALIKRIRVVQSQIEDFINGDEVVEITDKHKFVKKKAIEYLGLEVKSETLIINHKGCIAIAKPVCPDCGSLEVYENGTRSRHPKTVTGEEIEIKIQKYLCKMCRKTFEPSLDKFVKKHQRVSQEIQAFAVTTYRDCKLSGSETAELCQELYGVRISESTVRRWSKKYSEEPVENLVEEEEKEPSNIYNMDEQRILINGKEHWRYIVIDNNRNVICDEVRENRKSEAITDVMIKYLANRDVYCIVTDMDKKYRSAIEKLREEIARRKNRPVKSVKIKHQLCVFHLFKEVNRVLKECGGLYRKKLHPEYEKLRKEIYSIFYSENREIAWEKLKSITNRSGYPREIRKLLEKIANNFEDLTHYMEDRKIPMTNNNAELYFRTTKPEIIKKRYKSVHTLNLYLKETSKHYGKKLTAWLASAGFSMAVWSTLAFLVQIIK